MGFELDLNMKHALAPKPYVLTRYSGHLLVVVSGALHIESSS